MKLQLLAGTGKLALTGSLGKVMQESGHAAMSYIRHNAKTLNDSMKISIKS